MIIYIIRHGETRLNTLGILQGQVDEPLNENGIELAEITGEALKEVPFDLAITSPLIRARKTAELAVGPSALYHGKEIPILEDRRLMEIDFGSWDLKGCRPENYSVPVPYEEFSKFFSKPLEYKASPDGEELYQVHERTQDFLEELIHNPEYQDKIILVSTHGCAAKGLLNYFNKPDQYWSDRVPFNCEVNILGAKNGKAFIIARNQLYYDAELAVNLYEAVDTEE